MVTPIRAKVRIDNTNIEAVKVTNEAALMQSLKALHDGDCLLYVKNQRETLFMKVVLGDRKSVYLHYDLSGGRPMAADLKEFFQMIENVKEIGREDE